MRSVHGEIFGRGARPIGWRFTPQRSGTTDDRKQIEDNMTSGGDPLLGGDKDKKYQALRNKIMESVQTYDVASQPPAQIRPAPKRSLSPYQAITGGRNQGFPQ